MVATVSGPAEAHAAVAPRPRPPADGANGARDADAQVERDEAGERESIRCQEDTVEPGRETSDVQDRGEQIPGPPGSHGPSGERRSIV